VNHGRLRLISGAIRIIFGMWYLYPDFTQIIDYGSQAQQNHISWAVDVCRR